MRQFSGTLRVAGYTGQTTYFYNTDSVLQGPFEFRSTNPEAFLGSGDDYFAIKGNFVEGLPDGKWSFHFGDYERGEGASVQNTFYQVSVSGSRHIAEGRLFEGMPDGSFTHREEILRNSIVTETPFQSTFNFSRGIPQFSFRIQYENETLVGRFLRNGFAHDQWELFGGELAATLERWQFQEGRLVTIELITDNQTVHIPIFNDQTNQAVVNLDEKYMLLVSLMFDLRNEPDSTFSSNIYPMLETNASYYQKIDSILQELGDSTFMPEFKVKVNYYPYKPGEKEHLDTLRTLVDQATLIKNNLNNNSQLQLLILADPEAAYLKTIADSIGHQLIDPVSRLLLYDDQEILEYVDRSEVLKMLGLDTRAPENINGFYTDTSGTEVRSYNLPDISDVSVGPPYGSAYEHIWVGLESLKNINEELNVKLSREQRAKELELLEEELITAMNHLSAHIDSLNKTVGEPFNDAIGAIGTSARQGLRVYSSLEDPALQIVQAQELINCFNKMELLSTEVAALPAKWQSIREVYSDRVWNPFTATVMDEEVKKRITTSYRQVLIPYELGRIENQLNCTSTDDILEELRLIDTRMYELRQEDTKRLERRLRKERDADVILELFGIQKEEE